MEKAQVLIVEDDGIIASDIQNRLKGLGYFVPSIVSCGEEAIQKTKENIPDLVVMDIVLDGEMDGIEAANQIRTQFRVPVVYLTAYADNKLLERAKITEPFGYIIKPFKDKELRITIEMALYKHKSEKALRKSEAKYKTLLENLPQKIFYKDKNSIYQSCNENYARDLNITPDEIIGKTDYDFYPIRLAEKYRADDKRIVEFAVQEEIEENYLTDGKEVIVQTVKSAVSDEKGNVIGLLGILWDISKRKQTEDALNKARDELKRRVKERTAELTEANEQLKREIAEHKQTQEALQESEEKHRTFLGANLEPVVVCDMEGQVVYFNAAFTNVFGWTLEECLGKKIDAFVPEEAWPETNVMINKMLAGEPISIFSTSRYHKKGNTIPVNISGSLYRDKNGNPVGSIINLRDASEQKNLEAQLLQAQKMEAVGTLAGGIAHDFNNILQAISGISELLLADKDRHDPDYESLVKIIQSARKAADLIRQLLIFSRKVESELKPVILNQQIIKASKLLERTIPKMIRIEHNLAQDLKIINADPLQIEQILMNLGVNAKDAMPDGGRLIFETENITLDEQYCKTHPGASLGEYVLMSVSDTGHGMDNETREHIFEPFYTTKEVGKGTGLGLAMVYGIVKSHAGYILCYSEPGLGTTFKIYFPVLITESPEQREDSRAEALPGGRETILLVDDDTDVLKVGKAMLEHRGYTTIMAESGERAVEIYEKEKEFIDLVILDVGMPGMGGHKCLEHLIKIDPGIKVVIATGYAPSGKVKETLESGAVGYIAKPFLLADILKKVREALDKKTGFMI